MPEIKNRRFGLVVFVCIFNRDFSKILLLRRNKEKRKHAEWGNIGGRIEFGETSAEACIREAKEEIGVELKPENLKLIEIKEIPNYHNNVHAVQFIYSITFDENEKIIINEESESYAWFNLNSLPDKTLDSREEILRLSALAKK